MHYVLYAINIFKFIDHAIGEQNVRGKAKGVKSGEGIEVEIYDGR